MHKTTSAAKGSVPTAFLQQYGPNIIGNLSGFDRLRLRGTLRQLYCPKVMEAYLSASHVLLKDFGKLVNRVTQAVKQKAKDLAQRLRRPYLYVGLSQTRKEDLAREIAEKERITKGLIAVLGAVEPCQSFRVCGNAQTRQLELKLQTRKCTHLYFYYEHEKFGFMHLRLQTWFPFQVDICLNGRHWLARQLDEAKIAYQKKHNTFLRVADLEKAQVLLDEQLKTDWKSELKRLLRQSHPLHERICSPLNLRYYWSASETEYATDVIFRDAESLARLYPSFVHHAMSSFSSTDVMRFLGRRVPISTGQVPPRFEGQIISDSKQRPEGVRVKHSLNGNSIKFYDKEGSVLRVETTINRAREFKTFRRPEGQPKAAKSWRVMRRSLADMKRRKEICQRANHRYLNALAATSQTIPLFEWAEKICQPVVRNGKRYRAINPLERQEARLLHIINRGDFVLNGFRNRDLREAFFPSRASAQKTKRRTAWMGRRLRLFRAHGLIQKITGTHRYVVTKKGQATITAVLSARNADVKQLTKLAA